MNSEILKQVQEYRKRHPDIDAMLKKLRMTQEEYERALAAISVRVPKHEPTFSTTLNQSYNANVSTST